MNASVTLRHRSRQHSSAPTKTKIDTHQVRPFIQSGRTFFMLVGNRPCGPGHRISLNPEKPLQNSKQFSHQPLKEAKNPYRHNSARTMTIIRPGTGQSIFDVVNEGQLAVERPRTQKLPTSPFRLLRQDRAKHRLARSRRKWTFQKIHFASMEKIRTHQNSTVPFTPVTFSSREHLTHLFASKSLSV